jgi:hypothetical protein
MRTKTLLCAAALAAGIATSAVAQSNVYSLNVVGYYNVPLAANQKVMIGNQLNTTNNTLGGIIPGANDGDQFFKFNGGFTTYVYDGLSAAWTPDGNVSLAPGEGGFYISPVASTLTFVGEVRQGSLTNTLPLGTKVIRASIVPQAGKITTDLGVPGEDGDQLFQFAGGFSTYVYDGLGNSWTPSEPTFKVGESFFYLKSSASTQPNWIRNFTVQ